MPASALKAVYPGVDLLYYGNDGQLEYDLVRLPELIHLFNQISRLGADIRLESSGNLALQTSSGIVELRKPTIYQKQKDESRRPINGNFIVHGKEVTLRIEDYEKDKPLIVDPVLSFSTLIGANNSSTVAGVAADDSGDMLITGTTYATNYPTVNAFQSKNSGTTNIFVTKLNPAGDVILFHLHRRRRIRQCLRHCG